MPDYPTLLKNFTEGTQPVAMAYLATGRFKSAFPDGIEVVDDSPDDDEARDETESDNDEATKTKKKRHGE